MNMDLKFVTLLIVNFMLGGSTDSIVSKNDVNSRPDYTDSTSFIVQQKVEVATFPFMVSLHANYDNNTFICSASVVDVNLVLTSAKCLYYEWGGVMPPIILTINSAKTLNGPSRQYSVKRIIFQPAFVDGIDGYDLGLIEINGYFAPDELINSNQQYQDKCNNCSIVGWSEDGGRLKVIEDVILGRDCPFNVATQLCTQHQQVCGMSRGSAVLCNAKFLGVLTSANCKGFSTIETTYASKEWLYFHNVLSSNANNLSNMFILIGFSVILLYYNWE